jgi:hypothetical protein
LEPLIEACRQRSTVAEGNRDTPDMIPMTNKSYPSSHETNIIESI